LRKKILPVGFDPGSKYRVQVTIPGRQDVPCAKIRFTGAPPDLGHCPPVFDFLFKEMQKEKNTSMFGVQC